MMEPFSNHAESSSPSRVTGRRTGDASDVTVCSIGYERRSADELLRIIRDASVECLIDVRHKPFSRKPDFRAAALRASCEAKRIGYESWPELGSTKAQRDRLMETGDLATFRHRYRTYINRSGAEALDRLARKVKRQTVALLCYERKHERCHRSIVADLVADRVNATVLALS